ncbi:MAG: hypothetical protein FD178_2365 [Ignavibacteria bacterium]|nr:MAG: hypothetical protein FD178_2365 [Ignavibacteria bacterium]
MLTKNQFSQSLCVLSRITILIPFIFIFNSCKDVGVDFNETLPNPIVTSEELKIYGMVLEEINTNSILVIADTTRAIKGDAGYYVKFNDFIDDYPNLQKETHEALINPLVKQRVFQNLPYDEKHNLVLQSKHTWPSIEYGIKGFVKFSHIAFNKNRTQALLLITHYDGPYSGWEKNVVLEKQNNEWKIAKSFNISILG